MRIGKLAKRTGITVKAVRFYATKDLLGPVPRRGRYREFGPQHEARIRMILDAKALGFSLREVAVVLDHDPAGGAREALRTVDAKISERRAEIRSAQRALRRLQAARNRIVDCAPT